MFAMHSNQKTSLAQHMVISGKGVLVPAVLVARQVETRTGNPADVAAIFIESTAALTLAQIGHSGPLTHLWLPIDRTVTEEDGTISFFYDVPSFGPEEIFDGARYREYITIETKAGPFQPDDLILVLARTGK